ncbi:hypothetical protein L208DRAFT_1379353 [Tricholoma matsutake]|nr:hypothetical protein L208DRAFT_1379353 [Tricholoma matsutake 945]
MDHEGDPSFLIYNAIKPFYPSGTLQATYISLVYNIPDNDGGAGLHQYNESIDQVITKFSGCFSYTQFIVFLTTHSTPDSGLLWNVPGGKGAVAVQQLDSRRQISEFAQNCFAAIWGFTSFDLRPNLTGLFLQSLILAFCPALLEKLFQESVELGAHSGVVIYLGQGGVYEYFWAHPAARPLSVILLLNCSLCGHLDSWAIPKLAILALPMMVEIPCAKCSNTFSSLILALCQITAKSRDASSEWFAWCLDKPNTIKSLKWSYVEGVLKGNSH